MSPSQGKPSSVRVDAGAPRDAPGSDDIEELALAIGRRITGLRSTRGWSLSTLANRAKLGKATLSEIEAGRRNPTLETLYAIAGQLDTPLAYLLTEDGASTPPPARLSGDAVTARLIDVFADDDATTEIYQLTVRPGRTQVSPGHGAGVIEHLIVSSGILVAGPLAAPIRLQAGEHGQWESSAEHSYCAVGGDIVEAVLVIRHPKRRQNRF
ncbi:helix-turn-helix domain-containing protein [Jatrophihabitans sp. DSM 45814]